MNAAVNMPGWFSQLLGRLFLGTFKKCSDKDLFAMKAYLEKGA